MRILFVSALYSSPMQPQRGVGNARILHAMRPHCELRVVSPLPWYPEALVKRRPDLLALSRLPREEQDDDGSSIFHPRIAHLPRFGRALYPALYAASLAPQLRGEIARFRPDVILSAWAYPDGTAAAALGRLFRLPTVLRVMGSDINDYARQRWRRPQIAWAVRAIDRVIAVSRALGRACEALGAPFDRVDYIPTGVDRSRFHPVDRAQARRELALGDARVVVVPGRLAPEKGLVGFLDAWAALDPAWRAILVGDGPQRGELEARARELGLGDRVTFAGFQPEARMKLYYSAADLVALPSLEEGWPDVLMESFACGCPWVASDVGGVRDILALTGSGVVVPPGSRDRLAAGLRDALSRRWDREATARTMERWTLDATARAYVATCEKAAAAPRVR
jgi:glycosyltransferase involved in cell wall biosynthesis